MNFKVSAKLTSSAGICKHKYITKKNKDIYKISISSPILYSLFNKNEKSSKINGLQCYNRLECYISIFEHELTHLIIMIFCPKLGSTKGGHTETFIKIVHNLCGHTECKHMLLCGDRKTTKLWNLMLIK